MVLGESVPVGRPVPAGAHVPAPVYQRGTPCTAALAGPPSQLVPPLDGDVGPGCAGRETKQAGRAAGRAVLYRRLPAGICLRCYMTPLILLLLLCPSPHHRLQCRSATCY